MEKTGEERKCGTFFTQGIDQAMEIFDNVKFGQSVWEQLSGISGRGWCGCFGVVVWQTRGKLVTCFPVSVSRQGDMGKEAKGDPSDEAIVGSNKS